MIDLSNIEKYRENNRIEAKRASGGLPHSIWETYSAFANTYGGIILLGVEERPDKSLAAADLADAQGLAQEFLRQLDDSRNASRNILSREDVSVQEADGKQIVVIHVPMAKHCDRPIYVGGSIQNSYRRDGEGDYRCTEDELAAMQRDAETVTRDMRIVSQVGEDALNADTISAFKRKVSALLMQKNPGEYEGTKPGEEKSADREAGRLLEEKIFGSEASGERHPTAAALLMLGKNESVVKLFPNFKPVYSENDTDEEEVIPGISSENVFEFYETVRRRLARRIRLGDGADLDSGAKEAEVWMAMCEALANALIHADYEGAGSIRVCCREDSLTISNPGSLRISPQSAAAGGVSDPRNVGLMQLFMMTGVGTRTGGGLPNIYNIWHRQGWPAPVITQSRFPERTRLRLMFTRNAAERQKKGEEVQSEGGVRRAAIMQYLTEHASADTKELAELIGVSTAQAGALAKELIDSGAVVSEKEKGRTVYQLTYKNIN